MHLDLVTGDILKPCPSVASISHFKVRGRKLKKNRMVQPKIEVPTIQELPSRTLLQRLKLNWYEQQAPIFAFLGN